MKKSIQPLLMFNNSQMLSNSLFYKGLYKTLHLRSKALKKLYDYRTIYIDVSNYAKNDKKTGIQRVVREIILQFINDDQLKNKVKFVVASPKIGYREVRLQNTNNITFVISTLNKHTPIINPNNQDLFLGLDLSLNILPNHLLTLLKWKVNGVQFAWVIYDLLPIQHPEWFTENIKKNFIPWLKTVLLTSDVLLCISKTVASDVNIFQDKYDFDTRINTVRLGSDFLTDKQQIKSESLEKYKDYILIVGTLEPRKGHLDIIEALEKLWDKSIVDINLVIIGKKGWNIEDLVNRLEQSKYYNKKLFWLSHIADDFILKAFYQNSLGIIVSSYAEGYGLPLIEALRHNKPTLVRDIPVFHEIAENNRLVSFFKKDNAYLELELSNWIENIKLNHINPTSDNSIKSQPVPNWADCKNDLIQAFNSNTSYNDL